MHAHVHTHTCAHNRGTANHHMTASVFYGFEALAAFGKGHSVTLCGTWMGGGQWQPNFPSRRDPKSLSPRRMVSTRIEGWGALKSSYFDLS
eukprot:6459899-Amphidinium_carterae.4